VGVEYRHYLIPRDNTFRPELAVVLKLVEAWREAGFVAKPGAAALATAQFGTRRAEAHARQTGALVRTARSEEPFKDHDVLRRDEVIVEWPVHDRIAMGVTHPLANSETLEAGGDGAYYDLAVHLAEDFINASSDVVSLEVTDCSCGEKLEYWLGEAKDIFHASRIHRLCPRCGIAFRPQDHRAYYVSGLTGEPLELMGGAAYRFAIVVDCGKCWDHGASQLPRGTRAFVDVCENVLGGELYQVSDFY
jgi:hypothetical protein